MQWKEICNGNKILLGSTAIQFVYRGLINKENHNDEELYFQCLVLALCSIFRDL